MPVLVEDDVIAQGVDVRRVWRREGAELAVRQRSYLAFECHADRSARSSQRRLGKRDLLCMPR